MHSFDHSIFKTNSELSGFALKTKNTENKHKNDNLGILLRENKMHGVLGLGLMKLFLEKLSSIS